MSTPWQQNKEDDFPDKNYAINKFTQFDNILCIHFSWKAKETIEKQPVRLDWHDMRLGLQKLTMWVQITCYILVIIFSFVWNNPFL